jgi:hypothetical protein
MFFGSKLMRSDQLARPWWTIRGIEASTEGLTVAEIGISPYPFKFRTLPSSGKDAKLANKNIRKSLTPPHTFSGLYFSVKIL